MAEPAVSVPPANVGPVLFKLSEQLATHKGMVSELELKQPRVSAFVKYGAPWKEFTSGPIHDRRTHFEFNYAAVLGFVHEMTGHDTVVLSSMPACDMEPLAYTIVGVIGTRNPL